MSNRSARFRSRRHKDSDGRGFEDLSYVFHDNLHSLHSGRRDGGILPSCSRQYTIKAILMVEVPFGPNGFDPLPTAIGSIRLITDKFFKRPKEKI